MAAGMIDDGGFDGGGRGSDFYGLKLGNAVVAPLSP